MQQAIGRGSLNLDWSDVHMFLTIVRCGSLRSAARELSIDVSTVSRRLTQLERVAGARLLTRDARRLEVTSAGAQMVSSGERMASEIAGLGRKIASVDRRLGGLVRITAPGSLMSIVSEVVRDLARSHPEIELELLSLDALLPVDGSQHDIAIRIAEAPPEHLVGVRISRLRAAVYGSRGYLSQQRAAIGDASHRWVEWDRRLSTKPGFHWLTQHFPARAIAARGLSTLDVHALVHAGVGLGALPRVVGDDDPSLRRLLEIPDEIASSIWVLTHHELRDVPRVRAVMAAIKRALTAAKPRL